VLVLGKIDVDLDEDVEMAELLLELEPEAEPAALEAEVLLGRVIVALGRVTGLSAVAH
jgi:hypothetical protein